jgi:hypothetical protein
MTNAKRWSPTEEERDLFFPDADPGMEPTGSRVLVQLKAPGRVIGNGFLYKSQETIDRERENTQVALVRAMGPLAFHNRSTLEPWPEGQWCRAGDIVIVPRFGRSERWLVRLGGDREPVEFCLYDDTAIVGHLLRNPADTWG